VTGVNGSYTNEQGLLGRGWEGVQFTFEYGELFGLSLEDEQSIDWLMERYCSGKRTALNRLLEGASVKKAVHQLEGLSRLALNWRYCEHAARDAQAELKSQHKLILLYLTDVNDKVGDLEKRLAKASRRPKKLESQLEKLKKKRGILQKLATGDTTLKVVFGSRKLFVRRAGGKTSLQEWRRARNSQVYSIGQANQHGNANIRIDSDRVGINIPQQAEPRRAKGRTYRVKNVRRWFNLRVNEKFRVTMDQLQTSGRAYSVRMIKEKGRFLVRVSFEIDLPQLNHVPERVCSIDSNPCGFAVALVSRDGNLFAHRFFRNDRLIYASANKRNDAVGKLVAEIMVWASGLGAEAFAIEKLDMRNRRDFGHRANRVIYAFVRKKFAETLTMQCWKKQLPVITVNPAYTSKIGNLKYRKQYGLSIHEAAAFCIGRRAYGHSEKLEDPIEITVKNEGVKHKVSVLYVWASIYGHGFSVDPRMEPPCRKGSMETKLNSQDTAVFTGHPASALTPLSLCGCDWVRKGREPSENLEATGNGVKPALPTYGGGDASATPSHINNDT